jgi:hypothetical protein
MINKITFIPASTQTELVVPSPKPTKKYLPNWYKDIMPVTYKSLKFDNSGNIKTNIKNCIPFMDIMTSGYIQESWVDIEIKENNNRIDYFYGGVSGHDAPIPMSHRDASSVPVQEDFYPFEFVWNQVWFPKLPKGYSYLLCHPFNRIELPFYTIGGIVDADKYNASIGGNIPFYIKKGFSGTIPLGTPLYQIIPFKRDNWKSVFEKYNENKAKLSNYNVRKFFVGGYKKQYWSKKEYN